MRRVSGERLAASVRVECVQWERTSLPLESFSVATLISGSCDGWILAVSGQSCAVVDTDWTL